MDTQHLLIFMAAARARLYHALLGIDEQTLITLPVFANWTAANLLAHIGEYDLIFRERLVRLQHGQPITPIDVEVHNAGLLQRVGGRSLAESVAYCDESRAAFLDAFAATSEALLDEALTIGDYTYPPRWWVERRAGHDYDHTRDLERWRAGFTVPADACQTRVILAATMRAAHTDFLTSLHLVADNERETQGVCGVWNAKDVLGHLADWDRRTLHTINPHTADIDGLAGLKDIDAINGAMQAHHADESWDTVWAYAEQQRRAVLDELAQNELCEPATPAYATAYQALWMVAEHYMEHAAILRAAVGMPLDAVWLRFTGRFS